MYVHVQSILPFIRHGKNPNGTLTIDMNSSNDDVLWQYVWRRGGARLDISQLQKPRAYMSTHQMTSRPHATHHRAAVVDVTVLAVGVRTVPDVGLDAAEWSALL